jgi:phosphoribosylformimino-5-aminoimidazole carboxamide ribotide isomerase
MNEETVFSDAPEEMAVRWHREGAERLHLVDLNGAVQGRPVNGEAIRRIVDSVPVPVQLGGGIRDMDTLEAYLDLGLEFVILGTAAQKDPEFAAGACRKFPGRVIVGIDARGERVAVEGWTREIDLGPVELARRFEDSGVSAVVYTDIQRDGMQTGPNIQATRRLAEAVRIPVIASGGISGLEDVERIRELEPFGVIGMITGRAIYEGKLDLKEAIRRCAPM